MSIERLFMGLTRGIGGIDSNTKLMLHMDGTNGGSVFTDSSKTMYKFGSQSAYFSGVAGSYLTASNSADFDFGSGDFCIDWWEYRTANATSTVIRRSFAGSGGFSAFNIGYNNAGTLQVYISSALTSWDIASGKSLGALTTNVWNHFAVTRNGNNFYCFKNGTQTDTWVSALTIASTETNPVAIGGGESSYYITGYIDELRVSKGAYRWNANFTPPSTPYTSDGNTSLLLHFDGGEGSTTFTDSSGTPKTIGLNGTVSQTSGKYMTVAVATTSTTQAKFGQSGYFSGTGSWVYSITNPDFGFGTGDFTIDLWIYPNAIGGSYQGIFTTIPTVAPVGVYLGSEVSGYITFVLNSNSAGVFTANSTGVKWVATTWQHLALVRTSGTVKIFLDGTQIGTDKTDTADVGSSKTAAVGRIYLDTANFYYPGYIDEVRVSNVARWTTTFIPPTKPYN